MAGGYRVLGVDPGSRTTGYGVIDVTGRRLTHVDSGALPAGHGLPIEARLLAVFNAISEMISRHGPDILSVEDVFYARNVRSAITLGQARGAALVAASRAGLSVCAYSPAEIKMAVAGNGRAEKGQIQEMVRAILSLPALPRTDAADALAAAICHAQRNRMAERLARAAREVR